MVLFTSRISWDDNVNGDGKKILSHFDDIKFVFEVRNKYAKEFLHDSRTFTLAETYKWFETNKLEKPNGFWIIKTIDEHGLRIGYFRISEYSKEHKRLMIGADIAPEYCGKGYATLAYKEMITILFDLYDLNKISLEVLATNERAIHLYKKLGFVVDGVKREDIFKNGKWVDSIIMSMTKADHKVAQHVNFEK